MLIVIVVIAILAAITIVAYNGIQRNASSSALKSAASQSLKLLASYVATENSYPPFTPIGSGYSDFICLTIESGIIEDVGATNLIQTVSSTNKYSNGNAQGRTVCYATVPGPPAS